MSNSNRTAQAQVTILPPQLVTDLTVLVVANLQLHPATHHASSRLDPCVRAGMYSRASSLQPPVGQASNA
jgi:hypothetical protein